MSSEYLQVAFMAGESLTEADIEEVYNNGMDTGGLDFSGGDLSGDQPYFIADLLSSNKLVSIVHIDLSHSFLKVDGFEAILFAAMEVKSLESFVAKSLKLPKDAGMSLSKLLSSRGCLKVLDVSGNNLGDVGVSNLSGAFSTDHSKTLPKQLLSVVTITVLDLSGNDIGDAGALALCRGLSQFVRRAAAVGVVPFLKVLRLNNNNLTDKAALCIAQLINQRGPQGSNSNSGTGLLGGNNGMSPVPKGGSTSVTLQLEELALDFNPLTSRGICALLGSARDDIYTPLKRLFLANTHITPAVLELLAENLCDSAGSSLQYVNLAFSVQTVLQVILGQPTPDADLHNAHLLEEAGNPLHYLCSALRKLASSLVQRATARADTSGALHIEVGALHSTLFNYASHLQDAIEPVPDSEEQVQEIVRTLEALNQTEVAKVLNLQVVPNVAQWVRSAEYVLDEHSASYKAAAVIPFPRKLPKQEIVANAADGLVNGASLPGPSAAAPVLSGRPSQSTPAAPSPSPVTQPAPVTAPAQAPAPLAVKPVKSSFMDSFKSSVLDKFNNDMKSIAKPKESPSSALDSTATAMLATGGEEVATPDVETTASSPVSKSNQDNSADTVRTTAAAVVPPKDTHRSAATLPPSADVSAVTTAPVTVTAAEQKKAAAHSLAYTLSSAEQEFRALIRGHVPARAAAASTTATSTTSAASSAKSTGSSASTAPASTASTSTVSQTPSQSHAQVQSATPPTTSSAQVGAAEARLEGEYRKLRADQSNAFHDLSCEIDKLAHLSPTTTRAATCTKRPDEEEAPTPPAPAFNIPARYAPTSDSDTGSVAAPDAPDARTSYENGNNASKIPGPSGNSSSNNLVQIIGYMQSQIASMAQKQHLYETSFINKFSDLEYRIEAMEAALRLNNETLLTVQLAANTNTHTGGAEGIEKKRTKERVEASGQQENLPTQPRLGSGTARAVGNSSPSPLQDGLSNDGGNGNADSGGASSASARANEYRLASSALIPSTDTSVHHPSITISGGAHYQSPQTKSTSPHIHSGNSNSKSPAIPNELLITDLLARLEVVEGRMLQDRATALQSALNRPLHQERLQQRHDLLEILVENGNNINSSSNLQAGSAGTTPVSRRSPMGTTPGFLFPDGTLSSPGGAGFGATMTVSPYGLQATSAVPASMIHYAPFSPAPQPQPHLTALMQQQNGYASSPAGVGAATSGVQQGMVLTNQYGQQVFSPYAHNPFGNSSNQYYPMSSPPPPQLPYPPAPSPYVPHDPTSDPQAEAYTSPGFSEEQPQLQQQDYHHAQTQGQRTPPPPSSAHYQVGVRYENGSNREDPPVKQPRTDRPSPKREREREREGEQLEPRLEPFQFNFQGSGGEGPRDFQQQQMTALVPQQQSRYALPADSPHNSPPQYEQQGQEQERGRPSVRLEQPTSQLRQSAQGVQAVQFSDHSWASPLAAAAALESTRNSNSHPKYASESMNSASAVSYRSQQTQDRPPPPSLSLPSSSSPMPQDHSNTGRSADQQFPPEARGDAPMRKFSSTTTAAAASSSNGASLSRGDEGGGFSAHSASNATSAPSRNAVPSSCHPSAVPVHQSSSSPFLDSGYYNYKFDTPLVATQQQSGASAGAKGAGGRGGGGLSSGGAGGDDQESVQSQASSASNNSWRHQPASTAETRQKSGTDLRRPMQQAHQQQDNININNNARNVHHSINCSIINDISRNSLSMAEDTLSDSMSLLSTRDDRAVHYNNSQYAPRVQQGQQQPLHQQQSLQGHGNVADSAGRGRSKTPNFMRPTTANAFKAATARPSSTLR